MKRRVLYLLLVAVAVAGLSWAWWDAQRVPVEVAPVRKAPIAEYVDQRAKTRLPHLWRITMPYTGRVERITLKEGDPVSRDQVVARMVQEDIQLELQAAQAAIQRLQAAIAESEDTSVEQTVLDQSREYVVSMDRTVEAARERMRAGKARLEFAQQHFQRVSALFETKAITREQWEQAQLELIQADVNYQQDRLVYQALVALRTATALLPKSVSQYIQRKKLRTQVLRKELAEAQARLEQLRLKDRRSRMTSPCDGVVLRRLVSNRRYLAAGTELLHLGDLRQLEVEAEILTQDAVAVRPGQQVAIYGPAVGPEPVRGTVAQIYPAGFTKVSSLGVEQQRVKVIVQLDDAEREKLLRRGVGVGYRLRVRIFTRRKEQALVVPRSAAFQNPEGRWQVFVVRQGRARLQPIEVGLTNDQQVEVLSGLSPGEQVVLAPESSLRPDQRVVPLSLDQVDSE